MVQSDDESDEAADHNHTLLISKSDMESDDPDDYKDESDDEMTANEMIAGAPVSAFRCEIQCSSQE